MFRYFIAAGAIDIAPEDAVFTCPGSDHRNRERRRFDVRFNSIH